MKKSLLVLVVVLFVFLMGCSGDAKRDLRKGLIADGYTETPDSLVKEYEENGTVTVNILTNVVHHYIPIETDEFFGHFEIVWDLNTGDYDIHKRGYDTDNYRNIRTQGNIFDKESCFLDFDETECFPEVFLFTYGVIDKVLKEANLTFEDLRVEVANID